MEPKKANTAIVITVVVAALLILLCLALLLDWFQFPGIGTKAQPVPNGPTVVVNPVPEQPAKKKPSVDDLKGSSDKLYYPKAESYLDSYESYTVQPESGTTAFLLYKPEKLKFTSDRIMDLNKDTPVTAIAKENGYTLVLVQDGVAGWVQTQELVSH